MWSVVQFSDGIQLVPSHWMEKSNGMCKWPPFTSQTKIDKAIKDLIMPEETWNCHKIVRIFVNADTHEVGMKKLRRAEETSDMDTENEDFSKRMRKERARKLFDDDDLGSETLQLKNDYSSTPHIPLPTLSISTSPSCSNAYVTPSFVLDKSPSLSVTPCSVPSMQISTQSSSTAQTSTVNSTPTKLVREYNISRKRSPFKKRPESDYLRDIFKKLNSILYEVRKIDERVAKVERMLSITQTKEQISEDCFENIFPLKNNEELKSVEESLTIDKDFFLKMVATLKMLGGSDCHQTLYNIMKRVFCNALADMYSLLGAKKKLSFKSLNLNKVILASARARHPEVTEVEVNEIISKWLVQAKLRLTREVSKEEKEKQKRSKDLVGEDGSV